MPSFSRSFRYASEGIFFALRHERNFQIECVAALAVTVLMFLYPLSGTERAVLMLTMAIVLGLEMVNTALERVMDILKPRIHPYARVIKDVMAGAVLLASLLAFVTGVLIFTPYWY